MLQTDPWHAFWEIHYMANFWKIDFSETTPVPINKYFYVQFKYG